jgi:hypothetical protein
MAVIAWSCLAQLLKRPIGDGVPVTYVKWRMRRGPISMATNAKQYRHARQPRFLLYIFAYNAPTCLWYPIKVRRTRCFLIRASTQTGPSSISAKELKASSRVSSRTGLRQASGRGILSFSTL